MFEPSSLVAFVPVALALVVSPGPDSLYTLTRSLSDGRLTGVAAALGSSSGSLVHTTAAVLGLSAVLRTSATAFTVLKYAGAAYLVYLGIKTLRSPAEFDVVDGRTTCTPSEAYRNALLINVLNPKVAVFFLAFLPQFVQPGGGATLQLLVLGALFATIGFVYQALLAVFSARSRRILAERDLVKTVLRTASGSVLVWFGLRLALERRTSP